MSHHSRSSKAKPRVPRAERKEQLLDVTLELIAERGYNAVTAQRVARAAGVTKPIIYRIYPSIYALLVALLRREQRIADTVLDRVVPEDPGERNPYEVLMDSLEGIVEAVRERPATWRLALYPPEGLPAPVRMIVERRRETLVERARRLVDWGLPYIEVDEPLDAELLARMLLTIAEEHARIALERPEIEVEDLLSSARTLLSAVNWRS